MIFVPLRDAVIIAQARPATIRQWAHRGKLTSACDRHSRHVVYSLPDLIHLERKTRERRSLTPAA